MIGTFLLLKHISVLMVRRVLQLRFTSLSDQSGVQSNLEGFGSKNSRSKRPVLQTDYPRQKYNGRGNNEVGEANDTHSPPLILHQHVFDGSSGTYHYGY